VLTKIQDTVSLAKTNKEKFAELVYRSTNEESEKAIKIKTAELSKAKKRVAELDKIISRIYEDNVAGKINDERFGKMLGGYESEQSELTKSAERLAFEIDELKIKVARVDGFMELVEQYGTVSELTAESARAFIERVVVHEPVYKDGNKRNKERQRIQIYLMFLGEFNQ
jgi:hypothetical protein